MTRGRTSEPTTGPSPASDDELVDADRAARREPDWSPQDIVEEWGFQSFPASDPPANW